jgi:hypothetical protein
MRDQIESAESKFGYDSIQKYAEVLGPRAISILRQVATLPADNYCAYLVNDARMALAKLGDEAAYREIQEAWLKEKPSPYPGYSARIQAIGDDWALFALVEYLIQHANDPALQTEFGPADGPYDGRDGLLEAIRDIARLRRIPDLPNADYSPAGIVQWCDWLTKHRGKALSPAVSKTVSDPYLQCLARMVEWGAPDAMLDIAEFDGDSAVSVLRKFPTPKPGEPFGARDLFPEILREEAGIPGTYREAQGNLQVGLAMRGDQAMLLQIASELQEFPYDWEGVPFEAVSKLRFIGGKPAVDILVSSLGHLNGLKKEADQAFAQCTEPVRRRGAAPEQREYTLKACKNSVIYSHIDQLNALALQTLAQMIKNPPLPSDAPPSEVNFQKWRAWWHANQDHAQIAPQWRPRSFE